MDLSTLIQIPCHNVLANEIALNLKYRIRLKQFFNINLGIGIIKKLLLFVFLTYLPVDLATPKTRNTWKMWWWHHHHILQVFLVFGVAGSVKRMLSGHTLDAESTSNELSWSKFFNNTERYVKNTNKKISFFNDTYPQIYIKILFKTYTVFQI